MKNKIIAIICILTSCFSLIANLNFISAENINGEQLTEENFLNLPSEKIVEDFEYYFKTMKENSPLFNATKRQIPDLEKQFEDYKKKISESNNNFEQLFLIDEFSRKFLGHNGIILGDCGYWKEFYDNSFTDRKTWVKALSADSLIKRNTNLYNYFSWNQKAQKIQNSTSENTDENIETKIIEPGKIAYIKVKSFEAKNIGPHDEKIIGDFFEKTKNYENIIIDITGNGGGVSWYINYFWPILKNDMTIDSYSLFKTGSHCEPYIEEVYSDRIQPIDNLPKFPNLNPEDKKELTHFVKCSNYFVASKNPIKAKVWLLIDENVFSAAESFAILCKSSEEVTLVGKSTTGDGIGIDPVYVILPNSKVVMVYSVDYGLNEDGSCNAECGTKPDIESPDGENPLTTCLKAIKEDQEQ